MSHTIDANLVRHIGRLGRIELSDADVEMFVRQLGDMLTYVDKLQQLDTANVEPMAHAQDLANVLAADTPSASLTTEQALANAPQRDGAFFKVPKVIE